MKVGKNVYLDHAAATPLATAVQKAMQPYWVEHFANPASSHAAGKLAQQAIEQARHKIAIILRAEPEEIIFVSGGTESSNLAIKGVAGTFKKPSHMIVAQIEHHAVIDPLHELERQGWEVSYVAVDEKGLVRLSDVAGLIRPETALISIGYVNNEIGVIQPIEQLTRLAHKHQVLFHTDACQAGLLPLSVKKLGVDLMTLNAAKMHGPKGVGILYKKKSVRLQAQQLGGGQEKGLRSGTENVPAIVGMATALRQIQKNKTAKLALLSDLEGQLLKGLRTLTTVTPNGSESKRLPGLLNIQIKGIKAEQFIQKLSNKGLYISRGAACQASALDDSHVLTALQISPAARKQSVRFSLSTDTKSKDITRALELIKGALS